MLQKDLPLDAQGKANLDVSVPGDLPFPMTYTVDMEATDVSNLSVADSQNFLALPSDAAIGLTSDVVGTAGKPMPIRTIVTDAAGRALAGAVDSPRTAEDDVHVGDAGSRRRRERSAGGQVRNRRNRRRDLRRRGRSP